jgi:hypothetical protein
LINDLPRRSQHKSYRIINSRYLPPILPDFLVKVDVLRIVRNGLNVKATVDAAIDKCASLSFNLIDSIEDSRLKAENASDEKERKKQFNRGMISDFNDCEDQHEPCSGRHNLRRYYTLLLFQAYLDSITLEDRLNLQTFGQFIEAHPGNYESRFVTF